MPLRYVTLTLIWLGVISRENFTKNKFAVWIVIFRETLTAPALSFALFSVKIDFDFGLNLRKLNEQIKNLFTDLLTNMLFTCEEKCFIKVFFLKVRHEVQNVFSIRVFSPKVGCQLLAQEYFQMEKNL